MHEVILVSFIQKLSLIHNLINQDYVTFNLKKYHKVISQNISMDMCETVKLKI